jgi:hypothetical protein
MCRSYCETRRAEDRETEMPNLVDISLPRFLADNQLLRATQSPMARVRWVGHGI